jgi:3-aminobutyryl-CoA ammonia-lyase
VNVSLVLFRGEVYVRTGGDEGLFAVYSDVQFRTPVSAGDVLEVLDLAFEAG